MAWDPIVLLSGEDWRVASIIPSLLLAIADRVRLCWERPLDMSSVVITPGYISARGLYSNAYNA